MQEYKAGLLVIAPEDEGQQQNQRLQTILQQAIAPYETQVWRKSEEFTAIRQRRVLFVLNLGADGVNLEYQKLLRKIRTMADCLEGCVGAAD